MYQKNSKERYIFSSSTFRYCFILVLLFCIWQLIKITTFLFNNENQISHTTLLESKKNYSINSYNQTKSYYLPVSVYYEALCPDSRNFFIRHLLPSYNKAPNYFKIKFVPYGKAKTEENSDGTFTFACQHGPLECHANKIHSCAVQHIKDGSVLINYLSCMIDDNSEPEKIGILCAKNFNVNWNKIYSCSEGKEGEQLLKLNGDETNKLWPEVSFIPTILINEKQPRQASVLKDFWGMVCKYFPSELKPSSC
ncbi:GILT-like protein 1 [Daktulosphaira vitifoliae]|uniref:GILT-like protein 1 n=1 Tax=Daktulosphaira vitifoliae TaxID=58002 RepID=UPI0021AAF817|nr:GILT-like protein 1 [Daktulosphaira vitifoliae]